jgi:hypothetical protein
MDGEMNMIPRPRDPLAPEHRPPGGPTAGAPAKPDVTVVFTARILRPGAAGKNRPRA